MGAGVVLLIGLGLIMLVSGKALLSVPAFAGAGVLFSRLRTFAGLFGMYKAFKGTRFHHNGRQSGPGASPQQGRMERAEAAKTLGVGESASTEEVKAAHKNLMQKLHPDAGGNDYLAAKLNEARDVMLGRK